MCCVVVLLFGSCVVWFVCSLVRVLFGSCVVLCCVVLCCCVVVVVVVAKNCHKFSERDRSAPYSSAIV